MIGKPGLRINAKILAYTTRWLVELITKVEYSGRGLCLVVVLDIFQLPFLIHSFFFILLCPGRLTFIDCISSTPFCLLFVFGQ